MGLNKLPKDVGSNYAKFVFLLETLSTLLTLTLHGQEWSLRPETPVKM